MDKEKKHERRGRIYAYAPLIFWIAVILFLGSGPGSSAQTSRFIKPLIEFFFPSASPETFLLVHGFVRKTAHFVEYAILAFLSGRAFVRSVSGTLKKLWLPLSLAVVCVVALADEINQSFQNTRTSSGWDVLLDIAGGACALLLFWLVRRRYLETPKKSGGKPAFPTCE